MKPTNWREHIDRNPEILGGKPKIKGTRIAVELIVDRLGQGWSMDELREAYPQINEEQIRACLVFAADWLANSDIIDIPHSAA
jgi:uncharacterized protein (DUF433 family)